MHQNKFLSQSAHFSPASGISAGLVIYRGCLGHGHPVEVGLYVSHTFMWTSEGMVQNQHLIGAERVS